MNNLLRKIQSMSLFSRVLAGVLTIMALGGLLVALASFENGRQAARQSYDRLIQGAAIDIADSIRIVNGRPIADLPVSAFELLSLATNDRVSYAVRGSDGALLTGHDDAPLPNSLRGSGPFFHDGTMQGDPARFVTVLRRFSEREFSGVVSVTVGQTRIARDAMAWDVTVDTLVPAAFVGLGLLVVALILIRSSMRRLEDMTQALIDRDPYDLTPINTSGTPAEIDVVLRQVNRFMQRSERQMDSMRNLISDTAHQLRTPVAVIRAQAEMVTAEPDTDRSRAALERLLARTRSLGVLLDQMLNRAMVIHRSDSIPRQMVDLRDIALDILDSRDHELLAPNVEVSLNISEDPAYVLGDEFSLTQAAKNLLSNALKHGVPPVEIGVSHTPTHATLWIKDAGNGPDDAVLARLGSRFERTTSSKEDSAGIGLSIVIAVAQAFDGELKYEKTADGFRAALVFPRSYEAFS